jgi:hydroxymethylglutaryl-CoA lyase
VSPPTRIRITEVSPRDGLQNEVGVIPTADKVRLVELLSKTGVDEVEVSSFVSAKWVPQLGDAAEVFGAVASGPSLAEQSPMFSALVPNEKGMQGVLDVNARAGSKLISKVSVFTAASETFARKNTNATIAETIERFRPVVEAARREGLAVRGYISCVIACPFEGPISPEAVARVATQLIELGIDDLDLGDTIGSGTPETVGAMLRRVSAETRGRSGLLTTLHLHDTFGRAAECVKAALDLGVTSFDGSVAGLGGCPYASTPGKRAPGNISTETLVRTAHGAGFTTGVDLAALEAAADFAREIVNTSRARAAADPYRGGVA